MKRVPICSCGGGRMRMLQARTEKNYGRWFYRCPFGEEHPGCFYWVDELNVEVLREGGSENVVQNTEGAKGGGDQWKVYVVMLFLIIFFLIGMLIGKLLREVQPELMDSLIQATKDGDQSRLQALSGSMVIGEDDEETKEAEETEMEEEEEVSDECTLIATRWFEGLINKDIEVTNDVYSIQSVEFDCQELRKLVRRVHSVQEQQATAEENERGVDAAIMAARKFLTRFLISLAKQMPTD